MSCDVYVYDYTLNPVNSGYIELLETDYWGVKIDMQMNGHLGSGQYGANLQTPNPAEPITVWVDDTSGHYAPTTLGHLNGKLPTELHVTLYPLAVPSGGWGGGGGGGSYYSAVEITPQSPDTIAEFIDRQVGSYGWEREQATGVRSLVQTAVQSLMTLQQEYPGQGFSVYDARSDLQSRLERWHSYLNELGIEIAAGEAQSTLRVNTQQQQQQQQGLNYS